jgi:hypothetical protein
MLRVSVPKEKLAEVKQPIVVSIREK